MNIRGIWYCCEYKEYFLVYGWLLLSEFYTQEIPDPEHREAGPMWGWVQN